jgi:hypothetical protein
LTAAYVHRSEHSSPGESKKSANKRRSASEVGLDDMDKVKVRDI